MRKEILITFAIASLLLITPLTGIAQENKMSSNLIEQPDIDGLVVQIKTIVNEVLQKYGHIPMVRGLCNVIQSALGLVGKIVFCISIIIILIPLAIICLIFAFMQIIPTLIALLALGLASVYDLNCPPSTPLNNLLPSLKSLYALSDTRDITNLAKDCPCLQE